MSPGLLRRHSPSKDGRLSTPYGLLAMTILRQPIMRWPLVNLPPAVMAALAPAACGDQHRSCEAARAADEAVATLSGRARDTDGAARGRCSPWARRKWRVHALRRLSRALRNDIASYAFVVDAGDDQARRKARAPPWPRRWSDRPARTDGSLPAKTAEKCTPIGGQIDEERSLSLGIRRSGRTFFLLEGTTPAFSEPNRPLLTLYRRIDG
jgi:hypothetical protein